MSAFEKIAAATLAALFVTGVHSNPAHAASQQLGGVVTPSAVAKPKACGLIGNKSLYTAPIGTAKGANVTGYFDILKCLIRGATKGSTIRFSVYSAYENAYAELFADAKKRGVNVRFTTSESAAEDDPSFFAVLRKSLGTNVKKPTYLNLCQKACNTRGAGDGFMHAKIGIFSGVLGKNGKVHKNVVLLTSGNLSSGFTSMWNHSYELLKHNKLYSGLRTYLDGSSLNRTKHNFSTVTDGRFTVRFYPGSKLTLHPAYSALKDVNCAAKKGYGNKQGRTVIRVMMSIWDKDHDDIANLLSALSKKKCDVSVAIATNADKTDGGVLKILKNAPFPTYSASVDGRSMHSKMVGISGTVNGRGQALVYDGSLNFAARDTAKNDEIVLLNRSLPEFKKLLSAFAHVKKYSKKLA